MSNVINGYEYNIDTISDKVKALVTSGANNLPYMVDQEDVALSPEGVDWYNLPALEKHKYLTRYRTPSKLVHETCRYQLRVVHEGDPSQDAMLIVSAQAGHNSRLASFGEGQDVSKCAKDNNPNNRSIYIIVYKNYEESHGEEYYEDLVTQIKEAVELTPTKKVHGVGMCQAGCLLTVTAARYPDLFSSLATLAAPIRPNTDKSVLTDAIKKPMWMYKLFMTEGNVVPSDRMIDCWKSSAITTHYMDKVDATKYSDYKTQTFQSWYYLGGSDICANWYLEVVEEHFKNNDFYEGRKVIHGELVKFENITCPVISVGGLRDDISPLGDALALKDKLPKEQHTILYAKGGHLGTLVGRQSIEEVYPKIFAAMNK